MSPVNRKGYTLIELTLVIVLLGLTMAVTIPKFRQTILTNNLNSSTRKIIGLVGGLREKAIRQQVACFLYLDLEKNRYWSINSAMTKEEREAARDSASLLPSDVRLADVWTSREGKKMAGEAVIYFSKKGYTDQSVIHLKADNEQFKTLVFAPFLGTTKVYDKYVDFEN